MGAVISEGLRNHMADAARDRTPRIKAQLTRMYMIHSRKALKVMGTDLPEATLKTRVDTAIRQILD